MQPAKAAAPPPYPATTTPPPPAGVYAAFEYANAAAHRYTDIVRHSYVDFDPAALRSGYALLTPPDPDVAEGSSAEQHVVDLLSGAYGNAVSSTAPTARPQLPVIQEPPSSSDPLAAYSDKPSSAAPSSVGSAPGGVGGAGGGYAGGGDRSKLLAYSSRLGGAADSPVLERSVPGYLPAPYLSHKHSPHVEIAQQFVYVSCLSHVK